MIYRIILAICSIFFLFFTGFVSVLARSEEQKLPIFSGSGVKSLISEKKALKNDDDKKLIEEKESKKSSQEEDGGSTDTLSGITNSGNSYEGNDNERRKVELRLKRDINAYIIESYKAQGNKIIKDLNMKLSKTIPEPEERKLALGKIQESLKSRLDKTEEMGASESKKEILQEFLRHLIQLLDKRIDELEK